MDGSMSQANPTDFPRRAGRSRRTLRSALGSGTIGLVVVCFAAEFALAQGVRRLGTSEPSSVSVPAKVARLGEAAPRVALTPFPQQGADQKGAAEERPRPKVDPSSKSAAVARLSGDSVFGGAESMPKANDQGRIALPPIRAVTINTQEIGNGSIPKPFASQGKDQGTSLSEQPESRDLGWGWSTYNFAASNTFSHPLYFEDIMLERHGHESHPYLTPVLSGGRFFATIPMLPYLMTVRHPCDCEYKMGHFNSGDCVYPYCQRPPYQRNAAWVQGGHILGGALIWP